MNPDLVTFEWVRGGGRWRGGDLGVFLHGGGRGGLGPQTKAPVVAGVCGSRWVTGRPSTPNPPSVSCLLLFLSSIHLSFQWRGRSERNNGLLLPPLSSQQWVCILNRGHGEPRGSSRFFMLSPPSSHLKSISSSFPRYPRSASAWYDPTQTNQQCFFLSESATCIKCVPMK